MNLERFFRKILPLFWQAIRQIDFSQIGRSAMSRERNLLIGRGCCFLKRVLLLILILVSHLRRLLNVSFLCFFTFFSDFLKTNFGCKEFVACQSSNALIFKEQNRHQLNRGLEREGRLLFLNSQYQSILSEIYYF